MREGIFNVSLGLINDHNKLFEEGKSSFALGMNFFGDLTDEEFFHLLGSKMPNNTNSTDHRTKRQTGDGVCKFPEAKDWRKDGAVTPVKQQDPNQINCGSCWSFAGNLVLDSVIYRQ